MPMRGGQKPGKLGGAPLGGGGGILGSGSLGGGYDIGGAGNLGCCIGGISGGIEVSAPGVDDDGVDESDDGFEAIGSEMPK